MLKNKNTLSTLNLGYYQGLYPKFISFRGINFLLFLFVLLLFSNCKITKPIAGTPLKKKSSKFLLKKLETNKIKDVKWFNIKAKITLKDPNNVTKFTAIIRMRKDSLLWLVVKKAGVEGARVQITPDSIYLIDRIHNEYAIKDFKFVEDRFNLPAQFETLQEYLLGYPILLEEKMEAGIDKNNYTLQSSIEHTHKTFWLDGISFLLKEIAFNDERYERSVKLEFGEYGLINEEQNFSYFRNIELNSEETGPVSISIKFSKPELNVPKEIKFEIPDRYKRID